MTEGPIPDGLEYLMGGGEMGARICSRDWAASPLGAAELWPQSLRSTISLMLASELPMFVAWGPELTFLYNDSYAPILGARHPAALGDTLTEVWSELDFVPVIAQAMAGHAMTHRDSPAILQRNGSDEQTYFDSSISPLRDETGRVSGLFCACQETTLEVNARSASIAESERLRELFHQAPGFMAVLRGPQHVFELANSAYIAIVGQRDLIGKPLREALPELAGQGFFELLDRVYTNGEPFIGTRLPVVLAREPGCPLEERFVDFVYQPIRDASGCVTGIFIEGMDVTESTRADERLRESDRFARSTIDALAEHIAVLDASGSILAVNKAWREFATANGITPAAVSEGANYLEVCDQAAGAGDMGAAKAATVIREAASGERDAQAWEYACHAPSEERWFCAKITRFSGEGPPRIVVAHENITERRKHERRIEYLATHDALTDLPNRNLLEDRAKQAIDHASRTNLGLALFFLDLDNFKYLNDAYGHAGGDAILEAVARELRRLVRAGDTVARVGGDEFVILLTDLEDAPLDASKVARAILERFSRPFPLGDREARVTPSIGISLYPADGQSLDELLGNADAAMYRAKNIGRSAFQFYAADMSAKANERVMIEGELRRALRLNQFELHYQPQVLTATGAVVGMEALIRWQHPELGMVSPARFIPIAEETGLIVSIGQWVLKAACAQNKAWQKAGLPALPVAVNVSAPQLRHPDFVTLVRDVLAETGLDPHCLELEITESMVMSQTESAVTRLKDLKALGVSLSIDDFGTGYSNLGYLKSFPFDRLKIDQSFVSALPADPNAASIVRAIVAMGHSLGLQVIAEGVETAAQADFLVGLDCEYAQGYFFGRPLPSAEVEARLAARAKPASKPTRQTHIAAA